MKDFLAILAEEMDDSSEGFHTDIEKETIENKKFRKILFTTEKIQLVVMSLKPNEEIGLETHPDTDQFIRVDEGTGEAIIGSKNLKLKDGSALIIPAGNEHNITAGEDGLKIYTIYSPPHHEEDSFNNE
jgi:mannose-6-phosphate isomerase-like protein (cupin superfamily)